MEARYENVKEFREHNRGIVEQIRIAVKNKDYSHHQYLSAVYRHYHIAYCMLRGTPYERIEAKVRENNEPRWAVINEIIAANEHLRHVPRIRQESVAYNAS